MKRPSRLAREIIETILIVLLISLVFRFSIQNFRIDGDSMLPDLHTDEYVLVNKLAYLIHPPGHGDVIVFHDPLDRSLDFVKRVIGLPGDTIRYNETSVWVNGVQLEEPYISKPGNHGSNTLKIPPNDYFVLGDNRSVSEDSRDLGFVPLSDIVGQAFLIYWPVSNWEFINTYASVYAQIK